VVEEGDRNVGVLVVVVVVVVGSASRFMLMHPPIRVVAARAIREILRFFITGIFH